MALGKQTPVLCKISRGPNPVAPSRSRERRLGSASSLTTVSELDLFPSKIATSLAQVQANGHSQSVCQELWLSWQDQFQQRAQKDKQLLDSVS